MIIENLINFWADLLKLFWTNLGRFWRKLRRTLAGDNVTVGIRQYLHQYWYKLLIFEHR
jgi:hypothetical protein